MKVFTHRLAAYPIWLIFGIFLLLLTRGNFLANPWLFSLAFLYILFLPGFTINRFLKLDNFSFLEHFLLSFVFGLSFYFIINLFGILLGGSLQIITFVIVFLLILLFLASFFRDLKRDASFFDWRLKFSSLDLIYFLVFALAAFILWIVYLKGPNLNGDPYFHLAIVNKALGGDSLSVRSLAFTKTLTINPAYAYPVWQVFLAFLARLFSLDIFAVWHNIIFVLTILSFFAWYYLSQVIFERKFLSVLALLLWAILTFYGGPGYLFTRLGVPDTLAQLIILPLGIAFTFKYIFSLDSNKTRQWQFLAVNFLIAFILLLIHGPHYFYLLTAVFSFGLFYAVFFFSSENYKPTLQKILKVFLAELLVLVLVGLTMEIRSRTLSTTILEFSKSTDMAIFYSSFFKFSLVYKYGFFLLPLILVWRRPRWWLIGAAMLSVLLVYFTPLRDLSIRFLSLVFTDRMLANLAWYFFVFSTVLAIGFYLIDHFLDRWGKNISLAANLLFSLIFLGVIFLQIKSQIISDFVYEVLYSKETNTFVNSHYLWFVFIPLILAGIFLLAGFLRKKQLLTFSEEPKNAVSMFVLALIISFVLISPSIVNVNYFLSQPPTVQDEAYFLAGIQNDQSALGYLKARVPQKSVILTSSEATKSLSVLSGRYMAYNAGSAYEKKFSEIFSDGIKDKVKLEIMADPKWGIDYIYLDKPSLQNKHFSLHSETYQLIYKNETTEIYKIIK